jgi:hypothetical protein
LNNPQTLKTQTVQPFPGCQSYLFHPDIAT